MDVLVDVELEELSPREEELELSPRELEELELRPRELEELDELSPAEVLELVVLEELELFDALEELDSKTCRLTSASKMATPCQTVSPLALFSGSWYTSPGTMVWT